MFMMRCLEENEYKENGQQLINAVETFRSTNGVLPSSSEEIDFEFQMGKGPYYKKIDSMKYIVYFSIGFDNSYVYNSWTKTWKDMP